MKCPLYYIHEKIDQIKEGENQEENTIKNK